jgi:HSP20 family protein
MTPEASRALDLLRRRLYPLLESGVATVAAAPPRERPWTPPADLRVVGEEIVVSLEIPGVPREAVEVDLHGSTLTISGVRHRPAEDAARVVHQAERPVGSFSRSFTVPWTLDADSATAALEDGVLTVRAKRV